MSSPAPNTRRRRHVVRWRPAHLRAAALVGALLLAGCTAGVDVTAEVASNETAPESVPPVTSGQADTPIAGETAPSPPDEPTDPPKGPPPPPPSEPSEASEAGAEAPFAATIHEIDETLRARIVGVSWREGCPVPLEDLRYVTLPHRDLDGNRRDGELVVHRDAVEAVVGALEVLWELDFPIERMRLVDDFDADDQASMRANNTSAFNCRTVAGTNRWSNHAFGKAIDINPLRNPYVKNGRVDPPEGAPWVDRSDRRPGMFHGGSAEVAAFTDRGWGWGGHWRSPDYQHFSAAGS